MSMSDGMQTKSLRNQVRQLRVRLGKINAEIARKRNGLERLEAEGRSVTVALDKAAAQLDASQS
jgi:hypothetical protein